MLDPLPLHALPLALPLALLQDAFPDTYYTRPPDWTWYIIPYFFIGGIAGGSLFLAGLLRLFGRPGDRPIVHLAAWVALIGAAISGVLLIVDLHRPERFWHMLVESETWEPMFKAYSPMSAGSWGLTAFGAFATLAWLAALYESGRLPWRALRPLAHPVVAVLVAVGGAITGLFLAGYTGVLLSVTNRPVWADSAWLGMLFLFSAASTAAATLILLGRWRRVGGGVLDYLSRFDKAALVLELVALVIFLATVGAAARVYLSWWGVLLVLGVVVAGILLPLAIGTGRLRVRDRALASASLILVGGLLLRVVVIVPSHHVEVLGVQVVGPGVPALPAGWQEERDTDVEGEAADPAEGRAGGEPAMEGERP